VTWGCVSGAAPMGADVGHADGGDDGWRVDTGVERAIGGGGAEGVGGRRGRAGCRRRRGLGGDRRWHEGRRVEAEQMAATQRRQRLS
jgi:hypothetical protein